MSKKATWIGIKNYTLAIYPMIVYGNLEEVLNGMLASSNSLKKFSKRDVEAREMEEVDLDPGGSSFTKIPHILFELDGYKFSVHSYKVEEVMHRVKRAEERLPGIVRFRLWLWNFMMPKDLHTKLISKLEELNKTDEVIHAEISYLEKVEELEQTKLILFKRPPEDH